MAQVGSHLLEIGLELIAEAAESLQGEPELPGLRHAIIYLDSGIELVLMHRLINEHWTLIFRDPAGASRELFERGEFSSAGLDDCVDRLVRIALLEINDKDARRIGQFRKRRNKLVHFGIADTPDALRAAAADALSFVLKFVTDEFTKLTKAEEGWLTQIRQNAASFKRFVERRWKEIRLQVDEAGEFASWCKACGQKALVGDGETYRCSFCGRPSSADEAADLYANNELGVDEYACVKDGGTWVVWSCPDCGSEALVDRGGSGSTDPHDQYLCFACKTTWGEGELDTCARCGALFSADETMTVCDDCFEHATSGD